MKITKELLKEKGACAAGYRDFLKKYPVDKYPDGVEYQELLDCCAEKNFSYGSWLLGAFGKTDEVRKIDGDLIVEKGQHAACEMNLAVGRLQLARRMEEAREVVGAVADAKRNLADKYAAVIAWAGVLGIEPNPDACGGKLISWAKAIGIEVGDDGTKGPPGALGVDPRGERGT